MGSKSSFAAVVGTTACGIALMFLLPHMLDGFELSQATLFVATAVLSVSLGFIWGYGGILCFGQSAFFGLGAYAYAVVAINLDGGALAVAASIAVPATFALLLGYVVFYGRLSDIYVGVITLTVTLILFNLVNSTSGPDWVIGSAALGGFNGIPSVPALALPWNPDETLDAQGLFYLSCSVLLCVYLGLHWLLNSRVGRIIVALRENEQRVLLLGYDARAYKLFTFTLGGAIAGLAGCLFVNWGAFASPTIFGLAQSAQIVMWVIVGGRGTLVGPIVGCMLVQGIATQLGTQQTFNANLVLGAVLLVFVLLLPKGIVPGLGVALGHLRGRGGNDAAQSAKGGKA
jgi:branched-chain amino acid transport system permease protein